MTFNMDAWLILFFIAFLMVTRHLRSTASRSRRDPQRRREAVVRRLRRSSQVWDEHRHVATTCMEGCLTFWWYAHLFDFLLFLNYLPYSKHSHVLTVRAEHRLPPHRADGQAAADQGLREPRALRRRAASRTSRGSRCSTRTPAPSAGAARSTARRSSPARSCRRRRSCTTCAPSSSRRCGRSARRSSCGTRCKPPSANGNGERQRRERQRPRGDGNLTLIDAVGFNPIWDCVTCGACQYQCPVFIEHVPALQDMRRFLTMNEANMPETAAATLMQLEQRGHPWRGTPFTRTSWMEGLDVPTFDGIAGVPVLGRLLRRARRPQHPDHAGRRAAADGGRRELRLPRRGGAVHRRPGAAPRQRVPVPEQAKSLIEVLKAKGVRAHHHQLPALLQHDEERVPALRRQVRGHPPHDVPARSCCSDGALRAEARPAGDGHLPRLVLPRPPQRQLRRPARHRRRAARRRARRDAAQPREQLLLRRRRRAHVGGGVEGQAHQRRAHGGGARAPARRSSRRPARSASRCSRTASRRCSRTKRSA